MVRRVNIVVYQKLSAWFSQSQRMNYSGNHGGVGRSFERPSVPSQFACRRVQVHTEPLSAESKNVVIISD